MELSVKKYQHVTWKVRDFFHLPSEIGYSLESPEIRVADRIYHLRLYPKVSRKYPYKNLTQLYLERQYSTRDHNLSQIITRRNVSCKVGYRERNRKGDEFDNYWNLNALNNNELRLLRAYLDKNRDYCVPDGTFTVLCSISLKEQSTRSSGAFGSTNTEEKQKEFPGQCLLFSSRSKFPEMELSIESPCQHVKWKVPNLFQLLSKTGYSLNSSEFRFANDRYCLRFCSKGDKNVDTADTELQLVRLTSNFPERVVLYKVGNMQNEGTGKERINFDYSNELIGEFGFCLSGFELERERGKYFPSGTFTVFCSMRLKEQSNARCPQSEKAGTSDAEEEKEGLPGLAVLSERMKELLIKGIDHDVTICVQDKKFLAHRSILSARSPVFAMMLAHDTKERNTNTINIEDCDPESFDEFLLYVYSGKAENLTPSNAVQLYYPADKYDFPELKEQCVSLLKTSLSVESFCDVVLLAAKHQEKELLEAATEFFARNIAKIVLTVGWLKFLSQNPVEANELHIKSLKILHPEN